MTALGARVSGALKYMNHRITETYMAVLGARVSDALKYTNHTSCTLLLAIQLADNKYLTEFDKPRYHGCIQWMV